MHTPQPKIACGAHAQMLLAERAKRAVRYGSHRAELRSIQGAVGVRPEKILQSPKRRSVPPVRATGLERLAFAQAEDQYPHQTLIQRPDDFCVGEHLRSGSRKMLHGFMQV